jgi:hypothetical protein
MANAVILYFKLQGCVGDCDSIVPVGLEVGRRWHAANRTAVTSPRPEHARRIIIRVLPFERLLYLNIIL